MTAALFLSLVLLVAAGIVAATARWGSSPATRIVAATLVIWLAYVGLLGASGILANPTLRPPGILALALPLVILAVWLVFSRRAARIARTVPVAVLIGAQIFRVGVELLLHRLWQDGLIPRMLTFEGANLDILVGLTAPLAAFAATRGKAGARAAIIWNLAGLLLLGNVVIRGILTSPGAFGIIASEVQNRLTGLFPYAYLAGFLAPLGFALHVLAIRALRASPVAPPFQAPRE